MPATIAPANCYTAITFSPVQGFIEKSRKLRDLYGSSFLLSYLARALCDAAEAQNCKVISPAPGNLTQGTPNQIIIYGSFSEGSAKAAFNKAWKAVVTVCREEIECRLSNDFQPYCWQRAWDAWSNHTWEFFWAQTREQDADKPDRIGEVRKRLNEVKRSRNWTGINWSGESSTLSGADAIAWHRMTDKFDSKKDSISDQTDAQKAFYAALSEEFTESIIDPNERLSIPELIKRLITLDAIAQQLELSELPSIEIPRKFSEINRHQEKLDARRWTGWFQGDGDHISEYLKHLSQECDDEAKILYHYRIGEYLKHLSQKCGNEAKTLYYFSRTMIEWGKRFSLELPRKTGRIIYAGGDDFLGVLYRTPEIELTESNLTAKECLDWFYEFPKIWQIHEQPITVSVGFVWVAPGVPQRDVLQHCREAEQSAKSSGRNRIAIRILFNGGNYLEWTCPWWFLKDITSANIDWTHLFQDVAALEARHAFKDNSSVAIALFEVYFGDKNAETLSDEQKCWNQDKQSSILSDSYRFPTVELKRQALDKQFGILGDSSRFPTAELKQQALNDWITNLAKVGFHLHRNTTELVKA